jgi:hypothetical protein
VYAHGWRQPEAWLTGDVGQKIMKSLLLVLSALFSAIVTRGADAPRESDTWQNLARSGKGVCIAKVKTEKATSFVFFSGTNRIRPSSTLATAGIAFPSLDAALAFVKSKPPGVIVSPATRASIVDDAKILLNLSEAEAKALVAASLEAEKKKPNHTSETTR